jgi:hypothetical protein
MKKTPNRYFFLVLISICFLPTCRQEVLTTQMAFYHWQTQLSVDSLEQQWLTQTHSQRLYVKFFDVDWSYAQQAAIPQAELLLSTLPQTVDIVPTVFLTNRCFQELPILETAALATAVFEKIQALWPQLAPTEIQIDCDWTATTRAAYFQFLEDLKAILPAATTLSATIRLHQYRYPEQTGVPPVDRGMLMYYNMGDLNDWTETNSMLNLEKAAPYLDAAPYPLALDLALPLFRWGVLFREGRMIKLINNLSISELNSDKVEKLAEMPELGSSRWLVTQDHYLHGYYLYTGDQIRLEYITSDLLERAALQLKEIPQKSDRHLSFYHLDGSLLDRSDLSPLGLSHILDIIRRTY